LSHGKKTKRIYEKLKGLLFLAIILLLSFVLVDSIQAPYSHAQKSGYVFTLDHTESDKYIYIPEVENAAVTGEANEFDFIKQALSMDETRDIPSMQVAALAKDETGIKVDDSEQICKLPKEEAVPKEKEKPAVKPKDTALVGKPVIAIVIDDMGVSPKRTRDIISLKAPLTASFLTYASNIDRQVASAVKAGHEILVHVPMEARTSNQVAPDVLTLDMSEKDLKERLQGMLAKFKDARGINNHMGSRFTENKKHMGYIMEVLKERNMFFLDSKTSPRTVGKEVARKHNVEYVGRSVFLDNENNFEYIMGQLRRAEAVALKNGYAVAIGHPKSETYKALEAWIPSLEEKGIRLVHLSDIVRMVNR
jgi:polysaccharide deacetylase 2 family uncharacterized protein YibQ